MKPSNIISLLGFFLFAIFTIAAYYSGVGRFEEVFPVKPVEGASGIIMYFFLILLPLVTYLFLKKDSKTVRVSGMTIAGFFFWVLFITSWITFAHLGKVTGTGGQQLGFGMSLFFHILKYLACILPLALIFTGAGTGILRKTAVIESIPASARTPLALGIGWSVFTLVLAIIGFFWFYTISTFYLLLAITVGCFYRDIWETISELPKHTFLLKENEFDTLRITINTTLLVTLFVVISTNLVNIVRPYPIWWDDLGVYMNYPKLLAFSESTSNLGNILWQTFTGIGFLHHNATFAFFLNQFGTVLALLGIWAGIRHFSPKNHPVISLPLLASTIFMSLPMIVFQQAKDMKLDPGLLGISALAVVALFIAFEKPDGKSRNILYVIAGGLIGIAFGIKVTTLMLIIAGIATLFYRTLGLTGFMGYLSMFIGVFTSLRLWDFMNVNYPKDSPYLLPFGGALVVLGMWLCLLSFYIKKIESKFLLRQLFLPIVLVGIGFIITFGPWIVKNAIEASKIGQITVSTLIWWDGKSFTPDYAKVLSPDQYKAIEERQRQNAISTDGKTQNEDLGRYFGYETGINNYLKLPINLTLQTNQKWEFTDISYIFLAVLPGILLFKFRKRYAKMAYWAYFLGMLLLFFFKVPALTSLFSSLQLPLGYIVIVILALFPFVVLHYDTRNEEELEDSTFLSLFGFVTVYSLIFVVAAYGIVWYGILMYFGFLAIIAMSMNTDRFSESEKVYTGIAIICVIFPYFFLSVIPHAWNNLPEDSMDFKIWKISEYEGIFQGRSEYIKVLDKLNLKDGSKVVEKIRTAATNPDLTKLLANYPNASISDIVGILDMAERLGTEKQTAQYKALALDARKLKSIAYENLLYPSADNRNTDKIYRIGTFLTYYINENRTRFYDDSLIGAFELYYEGKDRDATAANMSKLGLRYLLVDLNAATIDQDPRRDLTRRYEKILDFIRADKIRLIATDSLCLQVALDLKTNENYMNLAGTNYVSYTKDEAGNLRGISQNDKTNFCGKVLAQIITENRVTDKDFTYLQPLAQYVVSKKPKDENATVELILPYIGRTWMAAFEILP